jgi:hypothetical protein
MPVIEGVGVENPTAVWMQLMNTRHNVLNRAEKWNPSNWTDHDGKGKVTTMCLANAVRYVTRGTADEPTTYTRQTRHMDQAEAIVLQAILKMADKTGEDEGITDIPDYNDAEGRRYAEIVAVLDQAIEMVAPYARKTALIFADDVMTPEEKQEIDKAVRKAENDMWQEYRAEWGIRLYGDTWRRKDGRFAAVPDWVRSTTAPEPLPPLVVRDKAAQQHSTFAEWVAGHQKRGWDPFWDELLDCDEQDPHYESCQAARKALTHA